MILRPKARNQFLFLVNKAKHDSSSCAKNLVLTLWWPLKNKISGTQYHHKLILYSSCHVQRRVLGGATKVEPESKGRRQTTPCDNQGINRNDCHSKSNKMSLPVISVYLPLNNPVINPPQMSSVCQQSSMSSPNTHRDNKCLNINHINSKSNELSSLVIPMLPPWNDPFINPTQLSLVCQQSSSSSPNTTHFQYLVGLPLICQIPCHRSPPIMEVAIFMDAWLMCISWHQNNDSNML